MNRSTKSLWRGAAALLAASSLLALALAPRASAVDVFDDAVIATTEDVNGHTVEYRGVSVQTKGDPARTSTCAFTISPPATRSARADCFVVDTATGDRRQLAHVLSSPWVATAALVELLYVGTGPFELCIQVEIDGVVGPERCAAIGAMD